MYLIDGHCDTATKITPQQYPDAQGASQVDFAGLQAAGVGVQFWDIWQDQREDPGFSYQRTLDVLQASQQQVTATPGMGILTAKSQLAGTDSLLFMGLEGAEQLGGSLERLAAVYQAGARFLGLTWNYENELAWGCMDPGDQGLKPLGKTWVRWLEAQGMLVDLAHSSAKTFWDTMGCAQRPLIVSHTCCGSLFDHPRNLTDPQLKAVAEIGGVVGITAVAPFLSAGAGSIDLVVQHICRAAERIGAEYVGIGSDFDGTEPILGLERGSRDLPRLAEKLASAGFSPQEVEGIMGGNFYRFLEDFLK